MSGGVDSSVAAYLIKKSGYETVGVTMQIWSDFECSAETKTCCSVEDINIARRVARQLEIPFYLINFREEFEKEVVNYFCNEYLIGRTPNPCIICNEKLKFNILWNKAKAMGADFLATGHYARIEKTGNAKNPRYLLKKGLDRGKDQSYFLFHLKSDELQRTLFPLGEYKKTEIRDIAKKLSLKNAEKAESQEICFVPGDVGLFIENRTGQPMKPGAIIYKKSGEVIGTHRGLGRYTIGQRKGLGVALGAPAYVVKIDTKNNALIVGDSEDLNSSQMIVDNWHINTNTPLPFDSFVKIRYRNEGTPATISKSNTGELKVVFHSPVRAIAPGQAAVIYSDEFLIGGGWIREVL